MVAGKTPEENGKLLQETSTFAKIHEQSARQGQSVVPRDNKTDLHYVAFVTAPEPPAPELHAGSEEVREDTPGLRILELDGRRPLPIDHGAVPEEGFLEGVARVVKKVYLGESASLQFSMIALAPPPYDD